MQVKGADHTVSLSGEVSWQLGLFPERILSPTQVIKHISLERARPHSRLPAGQVGRSLPIKMELQPILHLG